MFSSNYGKCLLDHVFYTETGISDVVKCIDYCLIAGNNCQSINFINEDNGKCQLNNATLEDRRSYRTASACTYYEMV